jgi:hypothetical protein
MLCLKTELKIDSLKKKYSIDKLYRVKQPCDKDEKSCIVGAQTGDVVAVLKQSDPTGRQNFWFVDNGSRFFCFREFFAYWKNKAFYFDWIADEKGLLPSSALAKLSDSEGDIEQRVEPKELLEVTNYSSDLIDIQGDPQRPDSHNSQAPSTDV